MSDTYKTELHGVPVDVLPLPDERGFVRKVIQKRLDYADRLLGLEPGSTVTFDDSAYGRIEEMSGNNPKYALKIFERICQMAQERREPIPFTVTADHINQTGFTREMLEQASDLAFDMRVIHVEPWWQR
jgi:hypothetical protein